MDKSKTIFTLLILIFTCLACNTDEDAKFEKQSKYFNAIKQNDLKLDTPQGGDWLYTHKEKGQTFEEYKDLKPLRPSIEKQVIYLLPIGEFSAIELQTLLHTRDYLEILFQLKIKILPAISDKNVPENTLRQTQTGNFQLLASYALDSLVSKNKPKDAFAIMGFTTKDLFPKKEWNFIFGLASFSKRVGVTSMYRFQKRHPETLNPNQFLKLLINVSSHEMGHIMAIRHCTHAKCTLNGSNGLFETELSPNRLCSECQKKLCWNFKYDSKKRLVQLMAYFKKHGLERDYSLAKSDWDLISK